MRQSVEYLLLLLSPSPSRFCVLPVSNLTPSPYPLTPWATPFAHNHFSRSTLDMVSASMSDVKGVLRISTNAPSFALLHDLNNVGNYSIERSRNIGKPFLKKKKMKNSFCKINLREEVVKLRISCTLKMLI